MVNPLPPLRCLQPTTLPGESSSSITNIRTKKTTSQPKKTWSRPRRELKPTCQAQSHAQVGMIDTGMSFTQQSTIVLTFPLPGSDQEPTHLIDSESYLAADTYATQEASWIQTTRSHIPAKWWTMTASKGGLQPTSRRLRP